MCHSTVLDTWPVTLISSITNWEAEIPLIYIPSGNINGFYFNPVCDFHTSQAPEEGRSRRQGPRLHCSQKGSI